MACLKSLDGFEPGGEERDAGINVRLQDELDALD
jgi:hypothetical protein